MTESLRKLFNLILDGKLKSGVPHFDPSRLVDVVIADDMVLFNFGTSYIQKPMGELTLDEAKIAYEFVYKKYEKQNERGLLEEVTRRAIMGPLWSTILK